MGLFSKSRNEIKSATVKDHSEDGGVSVEASLDEGNVAGFGVDYGPWDYRSAPDGNYVDFGCIRILPAANLEVMPEADAQSGEYTFLNLKIGLAAIQLAVCAAPKSTGLWEEYQEEINSDLASQSAEVDNEKGPWGNEIHARIPVGGPSGKKGILSIRFIGIDGYNWFVRAIGNEVTLDLENPDTKALTEVMNNLVIYRDSTPRPPRDVLPITLPDNLVEA